MVLLVCFALSYAIVGTATQVGRDARGGLSVARQRAWSSAQRKVANMRAGGPRDVGWWLWLTGATVYHTARYTTRGARVAGRSVRTGWSAGWHRGKDRYQRRVARRTTHRCTDACDHGGRRGGGPTGPARTLADRWRARREPAQGQDTVGGPTSGSVPDPEEAAEGTPADRGSLQEVPCGEEDCSGHQDVHEPGKCESGNPCSGVQKPYWYDHHEDGTVRVATECTRCGEQTSHDERWQPPEGWVYQERCRYCWQLVQGMSAHNNLCWECAEAHCRSCRRMYAELREQYDPHADSVAAGSPHTQDAAAGNGHQPSHLDQAGAQERGSDRRGAGSLNGNGTAPPTGTGVAMASTTTGEAPNIEAARTALQALRTEAEQTVSRVDQLAGSLQSANVDAQTLGEVAEVLDAADTMKAAAEKALSGLQSRHAVMEEAVNSTPHAANTDWYRH